ncbi:Smyd3 [Symbiodinium sp. CCMP2592]|nr:Smyd3 [Symbiodinium sp. CCMP2592]
MSLATVMQLGCLALMFGLADGLRESIYQHAQEAEAFRDECCCLAFMESTPTQQAERTLSQESECGEYKLRRPDRPFWYHKFQEEYKARCCWTTAWFCNDFKEPHNRHPFSVERHSHNRWCLKSSPNGTVA